MLVFLQFDSPALPLVERLLAAGRLPALAGLRQRGDWQSLDARATILQSATYPTLCTGIDVRRHGIYSAFLWSAAEQRARFAQTFDKPETIWERLGRAGRRSLIVDPLLAWPPREMAGVYLCGWGFEDRMVLQNRALPRSVRRDLARRFGPPPPLDDVYGTRSVATLLEWRRHLAAAPGRAADATLALLERESFDFVWVNFPAAHKAGHQFWDASSVIDEPLDAAAEQSLGRAIEEVYVAVDAAIGRIVAALPSDADLVVFSPTGMAANTSRADILPAMLDAVLAGGRRPASAAPRSPIWKLRASVPARWRSRMARALPDDLVADLTTRLYLRRAGPPPRAIAVPGENKGYIRFNLGGRERDGVVDPASVQALAAEIAEGLNTFLEPDGTRTVERVLPMSEIAGGESYSAGLPDLVVFWNDRPAAGADRVRSPRFGNIARDGVGSGRSGNHVDDAWALLLPARARPLDPGRPPRLTDLGATACALLGADLEGLSGTALLERGEREI